MVLVKVQAQSIPRILDQTPWKSLHGRDPDQFEEITKMGSDRLLIGPLTRSGLSGDSPTSRSAAIASTSDPVATNYDLFDHSRPQGAVGYRRCGIHQDLDCGYGRATHSKVAAGVRLNTVDVPVRAIPKAACFPAP